ncbi:hypothetical protein DFH08DRAFT_870439 [Mycena albidolilacea]|uniref:G domain-containing protein n=1 Tax=Mycena albidolilacea TaxID=1033008 RepID=A0AAD7A1T2_9AGAR|nr:hypothetical protein DFH08DRAFT_870439 [Mycena albidolilacea]
MGQNSSRPKHTSKYSPKSGEVIENADAKRTASKSSKKTASPDVKILALDPFNVRATRPQFRILVIGKANAGKTTLLKKVCDSVDDPEIFSPSGEKIDPKVVEASHRRGEHDITNQLVFKSNPGYIFHDSRGFESGSVDEIKRVKMFIAEQAATNKLSDQLHAIWYCLPTDTNRPVTKADEDFFNTGVRGQVPLIAIFTKVDGLEDIAFTQLQDAGFNTNKALKKLAQKTQEMLADFRQRLKQTDYPPSEYLQLEDMRKTDTSCKELIKKTAATISDDALRMLFVSVQRNNISLSVRYALANAIDQTHIREITIWTLGYFGHVWEAYQEKVLTCEATLRKLCPIAFDLVAARAELISAICICTEQTFNEASTTPEKFCNAFSTALHVYRGSTLEHAIKEKIWALQWESYKDRYSFKDSELHKSMIEIVMSHPLRLNAST